MLTCWRSGSCWRLPPARAAIEHAWREAQRHSDIDPLTNLPNRGANFALLLSDTGLDSAEVVLNRGRERFASQPTALENFVLVRHTCVMSSP